MADKHSTTLAPSPWVQRWSHLVPNGATVLDVACGSGRHVKWFAERACRVTGIDSDATALAPLRPLAAVIEADIENAAWPLPGRRFDAVIVTNYLWRPLLSTLVASLADNGVLIYETFAVGHERFGKPSNPDFLLRPGELLKAAYGLEIVAYEDGLLEALPRVVQRIAAVKPASGVHPRMPQGLAPEQALRGG